MAQEQWDTQTQDSDNTVVEAPRANRAVERAIEPPPTSTPRQRHQCPLCFWDHPLRQCNRFKEMTVQRRQETVHRLRLCRNCFAMSHRLARCNSPYRCARCDHNHHTMLHRSIAQPCQRHPQVQRRRRPQQNQRESRPRPREDPRTRRPARPRRQANASRLPVPTGRNCIIIYEN